MKSTVLFLGLFLSIQVSASSTMNVRFGCDGKSTTPEPNIVALEIDSAIFDLRGIKLHEFPLLYNEISNQSGTVSLISHALKQNLDLGKIDSSLAVCAPPLQFSNPVPIILNSNLKIDTQKTLMGQCRQISDHTEWTLYQYNVVFVYDQTTYATFSTELSPKFSNEEECKKAQSAVLEPRPHAFYP
jgi:hypothetical protein